MFKKADEILLHSVKGITDLIMMPGLVNLDFADVRTTMSKAGMAIMGIGISRGENRAIEAAERAISHPLLEDIAISGAKGVLMNITCNSELTMEEMTEASERIYNEVGENADIIWGAVVDDSMEDEMSVTVIATGIGEKRTGLPSPTMSWSTPSAAGSGTSSPPTSKISWITMSLHLSGERKPWANQAVPLTVDIKELSSTTAISKCRHFLRRKAD